MSAHEFLAGVQAAAYGEIHISTMLESKAIRTKIQETEKEMKKKKEKEKEEEKNKKRKKGKREKEKAIRALLELGAFEVLLQLEAGEGLWLAGVLLEVLPVLSLLALPQLQGKLQLEGRGEGGQHSRVQLIQPLWQNCLRGSMIWISVDLYRKVV